MIALIISAWLLIQTTPVQNFLINQVTRKLSSDLNTRVSIRHVNFALFNSMLLEGTLVHDQHNDTLLYAGAVRVNVTDWFFFKDKIELEYIGLENAVINLRRTDSVWNYQFIADYFSGPPSSAEKKNIELNLREIEFSNVSILQQDRWRGEDMRASIKGLSVDAREINFNKRLIFVRNIRLVEPQFALYNYPGTRPPRARAPANEEKIVNDSLHLRWNPGEWNITIDELAISDGEFRSDAKTERMPYASFDGQHILFGAINGTFTGCRLERDTILAHMTLSARERSGLEVKRLTSRLKWHPEAMEFSELDLRTAESHLHDYFVMHYGSFDDMGSFETKVRLEGNFNDATISSNDIAFFAPALADWKKTLNVRGRVKGTIDNLNGRNLVIEAGNDTYLKGNISMSGLPDINKTYIDFEADDFRTTYADAVTLLPQLRTIRQPRLDLLGRLSFRGNFTGFINDFVTYGVIETNLGTLVTDLNMKVPENGPASYSGNINTPGFELGRFIDNSLIGKIVLRGKVNGMGLTAANVNAQLDGSIDLLEFRTYPYQGITVKGKVSKKLFNGELIVADPNLQATLNGLIDFGTDIPRFNFEAGVEKADLLKLNLMTNQVDFYGKFNFNFTGNNIDNFLGTARIYDASLFRNNKRISFDSLLLESKIIDNNKVITAVSNEFDAALAGEFSIQDLPASFQAFLNKYYPAYIKPSRKILQNENFSFVVTTKNVDEYIKLVHPDLSGFNYSTITGRIDTKENLLDLNAEIPQFNYRNIGVYDLKLKAVGSYDSLSVESEIANVFINDSLNFPGTSIRITSANDISDVRIRTSANQTLNSAHLAAQVQTLPRGVRIRFRESNFDVNGKNWIVEKNGELVITEETISAEKIRMHNGLQEIRVGSVASAQGNRNDLKIDLQKVNIGDFTPYLVTSNRIEGLLSGSISVSDPFGGLRMDVQAEAEQFRLDNDSIGKLALRGRYYHTLKEVNFNVISDNSFYNFDVQGIYQLADSARKENIDIFSNFRNTRIDILQQYLSGVFSDLTGLATGVMRISGPPNDLDYTGSVWLADAQMRVKYTNVLYKIPNANIELKEDRIDFGAFEFRDELGNKARITKGILYHRGFNNLSFDFAMNTPKLLALSTNNTGGDAYYGNIIARANMTLKGPLGNMVMNIEGEPADSSSLYINTRSGREGGQADFVVWKVYGREMEAVRSFAESNLTVNLDVTANNYADMYVIIDELTGDIIKTNGRGNLKIKAATNGEFNITGRYDIDRGNYNFNFGSVLKKPFRLRENAGNYILWSGNPDDAIINVDAEYEAENVRFSDLGDLANIAQVSTNVTRYRGKVIVVANLSEQLMSPNIKFSIELPPSSPIKNDFGVITLLNHIQQDPNELNKQVTFLVVFNSFGPLSASPQASLAGTAFEGIVVSSISGMLSNTLSRQFSNVFQRVFNDKSIQVNFNAQLYSGTNFINSINRNPFNLDRTNVNLSVGKSLFNERLTFTFGSALDFGLTNEQVTATRNLPFLPDITAEWKITPEGRFLLTFFYRDSYNYLYGPGVRQNRSGASISYRRDFDNIGELLRNEKKKK